MLLSEAKRKLINAGYKVIKEDTDDYDEADYPVGYKPLKRKMHKSYYDDSVTLKNKINVARQQRYVQPILNLIDKYDLKYDTSSNYASYLSIDISKYRNKFLDDTMMIWVEGNEEKMHEEEFKKFNFWIYNTENPQFKCHTDDFDVFLAKLKRCLDIQTSK